MIAAESCSYFSLPLSRRRRGACQLYLVLPPSAPVSPDGAPAGPALWVRPLMGGAR